jgi:hypothetical protein
VPVAPIAPNRYRQTSATVVSKRVARFAKLPIAFVSMRSSSHHLNAAGQSALSLNQRTVVLFQFQ